MSNIGNIAVNDGKTTPVLHTFKPDGQTANNRGAKYADRSLGIQIGFDRVQIDLVPAEGNKTLNKAEVKLVMPRLEVIAGNTTGGFTPAPRLAYNMTANVVLFADIRATPQERTDLRVLLANILLSTEFAATFDALEPRY